MRTRRVQQDEDDTLSYTPREGAYEPHAEMPRRPGPPTPRFAPERLPGRKAQGPGRWPEAPHRSHETGPLAADAYGDTRSWAPAPPFGFGTRPGVFPASPPAGGQLPTSPRTPATGPHAGRGPKGYKRSDERIREDVSECLERDPELDASEIEVSVSDGLVTLQGSVTSRAEKRLAERITERCSGVKDVLNRLRPAPQDTRRTA